VTAARPCPNPRALPVISGNGQNRRLQLSFNRASLSWFSRFGWLGKVFRTMGFQPNFLGFQPVLKIGAVWTPRLLPNSISKLPNLFVVIDLRALHNPRSFRLMTQDLQMGFFSVKHHVETQTRPQSNCRFLFVVHVDGSLPSCHQTEQIADAVRVTPFVVVPTETLEIPAAGNHGKSRVENG